ncbi:hypothetical protein A3J20_05160 [Candidatus Gottesmanbacteria bacterium RIFCSPLOWO2_02_FULL_42_29]|uniref:Uncharacterized protein n=2 Tax=Candidatus Gottesmaniibacteriota TaxID=1752720 RepID=A0A1F6BHA6_9BACT|nr:MAG: hypothetical protein UV09_C0016G0009 [Candidatus Gottesmanbacteria bacterium GW2011_GWA2_42_18]KKS76188.1 MAG: hypothetical protein UV46_C0007G0014 [Candidatus Gottesmanbacteria bacterium GW2011_GWC2_42_8]OGG11105.1 MAG: hypothetical protein A2781_00090 [Candidatus Gottesmanbacteria bacterium RIFCSPHIGHO2_01_FULL_42_27]OGG21187.1 MAG: hypothetical protein A3E72_03770 [Candidatus Gottesmanbacteria bacterium RIFCSPHIGHO2_12_FULL_43_26]OGG33932.1 MAG: hypothetical protein A3G68_00190 [Cand
MLYTPHFLAGAVILKYIPNPVIGLPLAVLSHYLLDLTPHHDFGLRPGITLKEFWQTEKKRRNLIMAALLFDYLLCAVAFFWIFFSFKNIFLLLGGIGGVLPDALEQFLMLFGIALPGWQDKLQWRVLAKYGFISYPVISGLAIYLLLSPT